MISTPQKAIWRNPNRWIPFALIAAGLLVHWSVLKLSLSEVELKAIFDNPAHAGIATFLDRFSGLKALIDRPLSAFTYAALFQFFGQVSWPYFAFNLAVHLINGWLVYRLGKILQLRWAALAALLFLIHPLTTGVVAQVLGRNYSIATLFALLALWAYEKGKAREWVDPKASLWCAGFILLSIFSKQTLVILPVILLWRRYCNPRPKQKLWIESKAIMAVFVAIGLAFISFYAWPRSLTAYDERGVAISHLEFFYSQLGNFGPLVNLFVCPTKIAVFICLPFFRTFGILPVILGAGLLALTLVGIFRMGRTTLGFLAGAILICLIPTQSFFPKNEVAITWRLYPALVFFSLGLAAGVEWIQHRWTSRHTQTLLATLAAGYLIFLGTLTFQQNKIYRSELATYQQVAKNYPHSSRGFLYSCRFWLKSGNRTQALATAKQAVAADPLYAKAQENLRFVEQYFNVPVSSFRYAVGNSVPPNPLGEAERFIEDLDGRPLISGNWQGRSRSYVFSKGSFQPLFAPGADHDFENFDFYSPTPFGDGVLMAAQEFGKRRLNLIYYDLKTAHLTSLNRPSLSDDPDFYVSPFCVSPKRDQVAYRSGGIEVVSGVSGESGRLTKNDQPYGFHKCFWINNQKFLGVRGFGRGTYVDVCEYKNQFLHCQPTPLADHFYDVLDFYKAPDGELGLIGMRDDMEYRKAFKIDLSFKTLSLSKKNPDRNGDVLEIGAGFARTGLESYYRTTLATADERDAEPLIFVTRKIGKQVFAIAADHSQTKTLASYANRHWTLYSHPNFATLAPPTLPREVWLTAADGSKYQAIYFGPEHSKKMVLYFHGGPRETNSPRFNPYFAKLNSLGYAVLALNYPGSTGRGIQFEKSFFNPQALANFFNAVSHYLRDQDVQQAVGWSTSSGVDILKIALKLDLQFSAVVDAYGGNSRDLRALTSALKIPYFAIRGINDIEPGDDGFFQFLFEGGHSLNYYPDFVALFDKLEPFLSTLPLPSNVRP